MPRLHDGGGGAGRGVFSQSDVRVGGARDAITGRGLRCPEHISICGYNAPPLVHPLSPPLSTIRLPAMELGTLAGESVIKLIERAELPPASTSVTPQLVARGSTGPPPRKA